MEQSLKLIELGLNVDTADMMYKLFTHITNKDGKTKYAHYTLFTVEIMPTLANFDIGDIEEESPENKINDDDNDESKN